MKNENFKHMLVLATVAVSVAASAESLDRPQGFKIGQRMTLKPYVAIAASYDSNVSSSHDNSDDCFWTVNPGLTLEYKAEQWQLAANAFYQYNAYCLKSGNGNNDYHGYGESLILKWADSRHFAKGWALEIAQTYRRTNPTDDMITDGGRSYNSERQELQFAGTVERRISETLHGGVHASYYMLDYMNARNEGQHGLYGWDRWTAGLELGWAPSPWTDFVISGNYQGYQQENNRTSGYTDQHLSSRSDGWTLMTGIGSRATERISYRLLAGWSRFDYGGSHGSTQNGFMYSVSGRWQIGETWDMMLLGSSYYQPNEREYGSCSRVDSASWGVAKSMIRSKLTSTFDIAYRHDTNEYSETGDGDYNMNSLTFRLGANYYLNRYLSLFSTLEYRMSLSSGSSSDSVEDYYDYNRYRVSLGMRFTY